MDPNECLSSRVDENPVIWTLQVNAALALELYFKSLYFIEQNSDFKVNGKNPHNFHALFNRLSQNVSDQLTHEFQEIIAARDMSDVDKIDDFVKSPHAALYCILRHCSLP